MSDDTAAGGLLTGPAPACPVTLADPRLFATDAFRHRWTQLRAADRLEWTQVTEHAGFWSAATYADVDLVLRDARSFTSERGTVLAILGVDDPAGGRQVAATDPPRHTAMRARLQQALTVRAIEQRSDVIAGLVRETLDPLADGVFDFAQAMLALPVAVAGEAMGLPRADWPRLGRLLTCAIAEDDPEYRDPGGPAATLAAAHRELFAYFQDLCRDRRRNLGDDLVSVLITTEVDGRRMSPGEIVSNCYSVLLGAVVTTPHAPNHVLAHHIDDGVLAAWAADPAVTPTAIEEALRLASPASHFLRYATRDVEVRGTVIGEGDAVVCWLGSANRDAAVFPDAEHFDLRRTPNRHVAFGVGPHYCVGHNVARVTIRVLFDELLARFTDFRPAGEPVRLHSNLISGYKHVPITARPR
jgi:cytochrome P450